MTGAENSPFAAFLRGINLGRRRVTSDELKAPFTGLGFADVATFLASGNVVFDAGPGADPAGLAPRIEARLEADLGFPVAVFLRSAADLAAAVARTPFTPAQLQRTAGKVQVILLPRAPAPEASRAVLELASATDRLALHGSELYWLPARGIADSPLELKVVDRLVGPTTIRTHNTLARLHARFFAPNGAV